MRPAEAAGAVIRRGTKITPVSVVLSLPRIIPAMSISKRQLRGRKARFPGRQTAAVV